MNIYIRALVLAALAAVSLTQGCSCSSSKNRGSAPVDPPVDPPTMSVTISGSAGKGIVLGGLVNVHPIIDGVLSDTIATGITGNIDGDYSITIDDYDGDPFVVRVTANNDTRMRCDLAAGCGDVDFGGLAELDSDDFRLDAIVPRVTDDALINLSVLSNTAADVALNNINANANSDAIATAISNANSSVANRFGIQGDITQLPIVDLTDPAALVDVSNNVVNFNLFSASIVDALTSIDDSLSIADAVNSFADQFVTNNGLSDNGIIGDDSAVTLAEILAQASNIIDTIQTSDTDGVTDLGDLENIIDTNAELAGLQPEVEEGDPGTPSDTNNSEPLAKARALVAVLGDLGNHIDMSVLPAANDVTLGASAEAFEAQLQAAELASSDDVEIILEATAKVIVAFDEAYNAYEENNSNLAWQSDNGVNVTIEELMNTPAVGEDAVVESVKLTVGSMVEGVSTPVSVPVEIDGMVSEVAVYMVAIDDTEISDSINSAGEEVETAMGSFSVSGTAENAGVKLTVKDGSGVSLADGMSVYGETDTGEASEVSISDLGLYLSVMIAQNATAEVADPVSFEGSFKVTLEALSSSETVVHSDNGSMSNSTEDISVLALTLSGAVMNTSGDKANVVFKVEGDGNGLEFGQDWLDDMDSESSGNSDSSEDGDAATDPLSISLALEADLSGAAALRAMFTVWRADEDSANVRFNLWYPGVNLELNAAVTDDESIDQSVILTNQDGVVMKVTDTDDGIVGDIFADNIKVADIVGPLVKYTIDETDEDGNTFRREESLDIFE